MLGAWPPGPGDRRWRADDRRRLVRWTVACPVRAVGSRAAHATPAWERRAGPDGPGVSGSALRCPSLPADDRGPFAGCLDHQNIVGETGLDGEPRASID